MYNCEDYGSKDCPKGETLNMNLSDVDNFNVAIYGCWGVYCQDGKVSILKYNPPKEDLAQIDPDELKIHSFLTTETTFRGQRSVVEKLIETFPNGLNSLFLAGDNIYEYSEPSNDLLNDLQEKINQWKNLIENNPEMKSKERIDQFNEIFPSKKKFKTDRGMLREMYKNLRIDLQLQNGFLDCFKNLNVENIFLAYGNHDIETCDIFNRQINFNNKELKFQSENIPKGTYYNVIYNLKDGPFLNVIVIDTNLFETDGTYCNGNKIKEDDKNVKNQIDWFESVINDSKCKYNIVIGHIPYKASGHKGKIIHNIGLDPIFSIITGINQNERKVQAYFCADEHNQQLLLDKQSNCYLVVMGSGGTELDKIKNIDDEQYEQAGIHKLLEDRVNFGFSYLHLNDEDELELKIVSIIKDYSITL
jgi:hypothetical protein